MKDLTYLDYRQAAIYVMEFMFYKNHDLLGVSLFILFCSETQLYALSK